MKRKSKAFILLSIVAFAILLVSNINLNQHTMHASKYEPKAYNYKPANILDNVFILNNQYILPFIFTNADQTVSKNTIISEFNQKGLTITNSINKDIVGTGTQIKASNGRIYTVIVYGDVNGDGKVNLIDAQRVVMHHKGTIKLSGVYFTAGNVANNNEIINLIDAQRIVMLKKQLTNKLVLYEPEPLIEDTVAPEITLNGQKNMTLTIGDTYVEQGATALDNYDGNVNVTITGTVDTQRVGTYVITYTAIDSAGNKAVETRNVQVVLKQISTLQVDENNMANINVKNSKKYAKVNTNFILGSINANTGNDVTPLMIDDLKAEVNSQDLEVKFVSQNGKILVQCYTNKVGQYYITPYIEYGNKKIKAQTIEVKVKSEVLMLETVKLNTSELKLYLEMPIQANNVKAENDNNIYTILPITFLDQDGDEIGITANDITFNQTAETGKVDVKLPLIKKDAALAETNANAIKVKLYNSDDTEANPDQIVSKIGFAINQSTEVDFKDVSNHSVEISGGNSDIVLPMSIQLKSLKRLNITENPDLKLDDEKYYNVLKLNEEIVLGTITSNQDEEAISLSSLSTDIISNVTDGIEIRYVDLGNGGFEIRAKVLKEGLYQITPRVKNILGKNLFVKCTLTITEVNIGVENIQIKQGEEKIYALTVKSNMYPEGQTIRVKDIEVSVIDGLDVKFLDVNKQEVTDDNAVVSYIEIIAGTDATIRNDANIVIDILNGKNIKSISVEILGK